MDSNELNKIAGGVIGALLILMLLNFFSGQIYGTREGGHHGDEVLAYAVELEEAGATEEKEEVVDVGAILASADAEAGKKVFKKCTACHKLEDGKNGVGPHLWGVVGRDIGSVSGFGYSSGLQSADGNWDPEKLYAFLQNPKSYDSAMSFNLKKSEDRANVIAYLNEADGSPVPLQ